MYFNWFKCFFKLNLWVYDLKSVLNIKWNCNEKRNLLIFVIFKYVERSIIVGVILFMMNLELYVKIFFFKWYIIFIFVKKKNKCYLMGNDGI